MACQFITRLIWYFLIAPLLISSTLALLTSQGQTIVIPSWKVQSSSKAGNDVSKLSDPGLDTGSWYTTRSKATLMATLLENKVYNESDLFYSTNLQDVRYDQFQVPWFYRSDINVQKVGNGTFFQLKTNGISSRADVYLNGELVANNQTQAGAYVGLTYDITAKIKAGRNILLIRVHPTDYNKDLALGFVDWNPYPPDNGTGIWRDVEVKQSGPITISSPRIQTTLDGGITIYTDVQNLGTTNTQGEVSCVVQGPTEQEVGNRQAEFRLSGKTPQKVTLNLKVGDPQIWWPKQWGEQPLYSVQCNATIGTGVSDWTARTNFGIRTVTSKLNEHDDTIYFVNGARFQVVGAGYTSDMFLRFDLRKLRAQFEYVLDMGMNTVRLEGKQEHKELYDLADELGLMIMAGWECCDKWEGWTYNNEGSGVTWTEPDYTIANNSMRHEAELMQPHPSMLTFLIGSDFWPDDRATAMYVEALKAYDWNTPIIASASQRGFPKQLGNGGMKMEGPYDWVPPNYWYDSELRLGSAFSFGSELGAGVGTPELGSLKKFLSDADQEDLWKNPNKGLYHMSTSVSSFYTREIYNGALWARYGAPTSLADYLLKAQMADYEATRAQFEAFASRWNASRPATGLIYWMLNNAWPSLHWNLFDYYLHPGGSYFGVKAAVSKLEHVVYDYESKSVYLVDRRVVPGLWDLLDRTIDIELIGQDGKIIVKRSVDTTTEPNTSKRVVEVPGLEEIKAGQVAFLKLELTVGRERLSRNVYWVSPKTDTLAWDDSTWYYTPVSSYAEYKSLNNMTRADVSVSAERSGGVGKLVLENKSKVPAVFVRLNLVYENGKDIVPVRWSDNYVTLWPLEKMELNATYEAGYGAAKVEVSGKNVESRTVNLS